MDILWPSFLLLLGIIPLLIVFYIWMLRRKKRFTVRYSSLSLVRSAISSQSRIRRHLPFALFLLAIASLILALVRPVAVVSVPSGQVTVIMAIDVSRSMCSTDIKPTRFKAAQDALLSFIQSQKVSTQIGLVAFSGFAELVHVPSNDLETLEDVINSLLTGRRTAVGSAILKSIDAIAEVDPNITPSTKDNSIDVAPTPVARGAYVPEIIVLLTDGASNAGVHPILAAQQAADRGVRVYTIGFGTSEGGEFSNCGAQLMGTEPLFGFGGGQGMPGGGGFGGGFRRGIDEETLKEIADMTGGTYYSAESADELNKVFQDLPTYLITKHETSEVSVYFVAIGALLVSLAVLLSMRWHPI